MFKFFNHNTIGVYLALPVLLILLRLRLIVYPLEGYTPLTNNLFTPMWNNIFGSVELGGELSIVLSIFFTLIAAYIVSGISNSFHFAEHQSLLASLYYVLISSGFVVSYGLHPAHIFAIFYSIAIIALFRASDKSRPMPLIYNAFLFATIGWLFWGKGLWSLIVLFGLLFFIRTSNIRCILAAILGALTPLSVYATWLFMHNALLTTAELFWQTCIVEVPFFHMGIYTISYSCLVALTLAISALNAIGHLPQLSILESRYTRSITFVLVLITASIALPQYAFEILPIVGIAGSILIAAMMQRLKNQMWAEVLTTIMLVVTVVIQWKVKG